LRGNDDLLSLMLIRRLSPVRPLSRCDGDTPAQSSLASHGGITTQLLQERTAPSIKAMTRTAAGVTATPATSRIMQPGEASSRMMRWGYAPEAKCHL
jgi:hypothetical protein